jgi:hypothetical protein
MRAFSTANGGVMFIPDEIERQETKVSYAELVKNEPKKTSIVERIFGKRKKEDKDLAEAA